MVLKLNGDDMFLVVLLSNIELVELKMDVVVMSVDLIVVGD